MNGNTLGKEKETKYSPSKQRNKEKIQLAPKVYTLLCGQLGNMFPNSEKGLTYNLCDSIHTYYVTTMDMSNSSAINAPKIKKGSKLGMEESEFVLLMMKRFQKDDMSEVDKIKFGFLINAPEDYGTEKETLEFAKNNPEASMDEIIDYFDMITPDGLAPGDDGEGVILEDEF